MSLTEGLEFKLTPYQPKPELQLMEGRTPNKQVVERMKDRNFRLEVLELMLKKRGLAVRADIHDEAKLRKLDGIMQELIQDGFGGDVILNEKAHTLYIELGYNQDLLYRAVEKLAQLSQKTSSQVKQVLRGR